MYKYIPFHLNRINPQNNTRMLFKTQAKHKINPAMNSIIKLIKKSKKPLIMGILNLTPDSFSDGGKYNSCEKALKRALEMEKEGADIIDIGGESTGPNSTNVTLEEEIKRIIPILKIIRQNTKLPISIDTYKSEVAEQALDEGANMINDVTALRSDSKIAKIAAKHKCPIILMYAKDKTPRTTIKKIHYRNVIETIKNFLWKQIKLAKKAGILGENIIIDPGMGAFISSIPKYSFEIICRLKELTKMGYPVLLGASRKSFLGGEMPERDLKGQIVSAIAYLNGASIIRTHDCRGTKHILESL